MSTATAASNVSALEQKLWKIADKLRGSTEPSRYREPVLGLIFLKFASESEASPVSVPAGSGWSRVRSAATQQDVGGIIDACMHAIELRNPDLAGALPRDYADGPLSAERLGDLVRLIDSIRFSSTNRGGRDLLGRVYEYFLGRFASLEGRGGEDYTPMSVVKLLVEMLEPYHGSVLDPCSGTGGMFIQSQTFVEAHGGDVGDLTVFGQEVNPTTWRLARMNLLMHGLRSDMGGRPADALHEPNHADLLADKIIANPPFNVSDWHGERLRDPDRWLFGVPPIGNANYAWVQHFVRHLAPGGTAGFVLANGALDSKQADESAIRRRIVEADLLDCIVALPTKMFTNTSIPASLWFLSKGRAGGNTERSRQGETLFIDARDLGRLETRRQRVFDDADIKRVADAYRRWHRSDVATAYRNEPGFCASASVDVIADKDFTLVPSRYIEAAQQADEWNDDRLAGLLEEMRSLLRQSAQSSEELLTALNRVQA